MSTCWGLTDVRLFCFETYNGWRRFKMKLRQPMPELTGAKEWLNGEVTREELIGDK
ncbi:TlpA family protein disulfide reductase, partial [Bacillus altitudinis]